MILVDTSVRIELLSGKLKDSALPDNLLRFVTCGPIVQEVLQGLRESPLMDAFRESFLAIPRLSDPLSLELFLEAADIYRRGRRRGYAIRSSTDCLIAAVAIENRVQAYHKGSRFRRNTPINSLETLDRF